MGEHEEIEELRFRNALPLAIADFIEDPGFEAELDVHVEVTEAADKFVRWIRSAEDRGAPAMKLRKLRAIVKHDADGAHRVQGPSIAPEPHQMRVDFRLGGLQLRPLDLAHA